MGKRALTILFHDHHPIMFLVVETILVLVIKFAAYVEERAKGKTAGVTCRCDACKNRAHMLPRCKRINCL